MARSHLGRKGVAALAILSASMTAFAWGVSASAAGRAAPRCEPGDVQIILGPAGAGLGHWAVPLLVLDDGNRSCSFKGYATVRAYSNTKHWTSALHTPSGYMGGLATGEHLARVPLRFDTVASMLLEGTDQPAGNATSCSKYVRIIVSLPGWRPSANLSFEGLACSRLQVHPMVPGPTGSSPPPQ
jgi:hypothetical protein